MINEATQRFIALHREDDVSRLALRGCKDPAVSMAVALEQIAGWQTARRKLPSWAATEGLVFPPHLALEQCSSEATARYKAAVVARLLGGRGQRLLDLTGGFGVDFSFLSSCFDEAVYVERQQALCQVARHNFDLLGIRAQVVCADGADALQQQPPCTLIFMDPARRDAHGGRTYGIGDCTPNVLQLLPQLLQQSVWLMLKLSPMLDWRKAVADVGRSHVRQVHIVSVGGECKELLLVLSSAASEAPLRLVCVNNDDVFEVENAAEAAHDAPVAAVPTLAPGLFLYEPNASIMKAGCFAQLAQRCGVVQLARDSHLFVAPGLIDSFPGRRFRVCGTSSMNKKEVRRLLATVSQANVSVRHFPLGADQLRSRLKLSEGGSNYLFATTLATGDHVLILCEKA